MDGKTLKKALNNQQRVCGSMFSVVRVGSGDARLDEMDLDFVIVDNEHSPFNRAETAQWMTRLKDAQIAPFVRVPIPASHYITMALDAGAQGILAPYIETVAQVKEAVGACKWLPLKGEAVGRIVEKGEFPSPETQAYLTQRNENNVLVIGIESVKAMENLEDLLAVPGVDAAFVGPNDLSIQLGVPAQYQHPTYIAAVDRIMGVCQKMNMPLVIHFFEHAMSDPFIQKGIFFVLFGSDRTSIGDDLKRHMAHLRAL